MKPHRFLSPYLFGAPALVAFAFSILTPFVMTGYYSLTEWNGYGDMIFFGLRNYIDAVYDTVFQTSFINVIVYILMTLVVSVLVGLLLAGLVLPVRGGSIWFRVAIFTPVMLPMVVVAVLWSFVYNPDYGLLNAALTELGLES